MAVPFIFWAVKYGTKTLSHNPCSIPVHEPHGLCAYDPETERMNSLLMKRVRHVLGRIACWGVFLPASAAFAQGPVYRCPGNPVLYTDAISAKEAQEKGCKTIEGTPITIVPSLRPKGGSPAPAGVNTSPTTAKVDPNAQRDRDGERRTILESELKKEEKSLTDLKSEYNNGEPERRGDERNNQKYLDRTAELKAAIARKEADIAALKREIGKLP